jgi:hypothetical protein
MRPEINDWLVKHPRITLHLTPTSRWWLNLAEVLFRRSGEATFTSVAAFVAVSGFFWRRRVMASSGRRCC